MDEKPHKIARRDQLIRNSLRWREKNRKKYLDYQTWYRLEKKRKLFSLVINEANRQTKATEESG